MADPTVPAIFEAVIEHEGVFVRVDILVRYPGGWELVEVKSSTVLDKASYRLDVVIQNWVLTGAGLRVFRAGILGLDRDYVYPSGDYDPQALFRFSDETEHSLKVEAELGERVADFRRVLASDEALVVPVGDHCFALYECPYDGHCSKGIVFDDHIATEKGGEYAPVV